MNPDAFIVPYSSQVESVDTAKSSDESKIPRGAMLRRSRLLAVTGHDQELALQEEVVMVENSFQRERLDHELWESRRRIEEQGLVLDTRSQQLLNYTREHVEQSRAESERRIEAFMEDKIQVSHGNIQDDIRQHTHNLALQIQEQLCAERQHDVEDMEMRLLRQSTHFQQALELTEQRNRADVRGVAAAQVQGWNEQLEGVKLWTREYVDSSIQAQDEVDGANQSNQMQQYVDHRLSGYESHVEDLISARIREERTTTTKAVEAIAFQADENLEKRVNNKIATLTESHNRGYAELRRELKQSALNAQQKLQTDLNDFASSVGSRVNTEVSRVVELHETRLAAAIQQQLQSEHLRSAELLTRRVDAAVEAAIQRATPSAHAAWHDCRQRQDRVKFAAAPTLSTGNGSDIDPFTGLHEGNADKFRAVDQIVVPAKPRFASKSVKRTTIVKQTSDESKKPQTTRNSRRSAINSRTNTLSKQSRLERVRADSKRDIAKRAAERADALDRSHKLRTRSQDR